MIQKLVGKNGVLHNLNIPPSKVIIKCSGKKKVTLQWQVIVNYSSNDTNEYHAISLRSLTS